MPKRIKIKILKPLKSYPAGKILAIDVDKEGIALNKYWRDRIIDSKVDKCLEIMDYSISNKKNKTGSKLNDTANKTTKNNS